jgi:quinol monooxygenase YgiN
MIVFTLRMVAPRPRRHELLQSLTALLEPTRVQPGCTACRLYADLENLSVFTFASEWESQADLDRCLGSDAFKTVLAAMELSVEAPEIRFDSVARRAGLEVIAAARSPGPQ